MAVKFKFESLGQPFEADWPVLVPVPQDGGKVTEEEFLVRWKRVMPDRVKELLAGPDGWPAVIREALVKVYDEGKDVQTPALVDQLLADPRVELALMKSLGSFGSASPVKN